ncbi:endonuclease domain-containing protein [Streptomyces sp. NBC_01497]|uniref:endonuclease domain-containing protein n=1 Tax=Streptomyces sp. NBC_01497 TaxID=2903885 RepID=UPI002E2F7127|nr:endonuclease domain-containing protein [Streptomyces sp. NBC_01497]
MPKTLCGASSKRAGSSHTCERGGEGVLPRAEAPLASPASPVRGSGPCFPEPQVDHPRRAGRVPGVLCFNCNSAIGTLGMNPDTWRRAVAYLEGNAWKPTLVRPGVCRLPS